ncbi:MAG: pyridoxal-phosphate dependent enzyme [Methanomicrobia archaeon]|nr:pyridoxal-phosphate dependent enzyme [Methanomicrobia archaeon]MCK4637055.1 pyridoxal-phosphate dependent enzyme [Methanomicrobia archaeon]
MYETNLKCLNCGKEYELGRMFEGCPHCKEENFSSNLIVSYDYEMIKEKIDKNALEKRKRSGLWKYEELLPIDSREIKTDLREGETPLLECNSLGAELEIKKLFVKDESRNPTYSFKDRLVSVGASVARRFGSKYLIAGGGNLAAAASAYSTKYNLETISFENLDESKQAILQTLSYGGKIIYLKRYEDRYELMKKCVDILKGHPVSSYTPSPTGDPYSQEGYKTIAYEICEQLNWDVPEKIIVPTGQGFGLYGVWRGFTDLYKIGLIDSLPAMIAAETAACGSLTKTFLDKSEKIKEVFPKKTIARHVVAPKVSYKAYRAIKDSNGRAVAVKDDEIMSALLSFARKEGIYSSTTSAVALAAAQKLREEEYIDSDSMVVCVMTTGGLKDPDHIAKNFPELPPPINGEWNKFKGVMKTYYNISI